MSGHIETQFAESKSEFVNAARRCEGQLAGEFASTDPSDTWTQQEVYEFVYQPLSQHLLRLCDLIERLHG